ncbi:MAG: YCF48-related protein [Patescibacteria group bacterium]
MKKIFLLAVLPLALSACAISFSSRTATTQAGDGGVFISPDTGTTWAQKVFVRQEAKGPVTISGSNIGFFAFHPSTSDTFYVSTQQQGLWKTEDAGETWSPLGLTTGYVQGFTQDVANPALMFAGFQNTIQKSTDGGTTWTVVYTNQPGNAVTQVQLNPHNAQEVFATTNGGVLLKSDDEGVTWRILKIFQNRVPKKLILLKNDPRIMFVVMADGIFRSNDAGGQWNELMTEALRKADALPVNDFTFTDHTPSVMYVASTSGIVRSLDGGASWQVVPTVIPPKTVPVNALAINPVDENELVFTAASTFYRSSDFGKTWQTFKNVGSARVYAVLAAHPRRPGMLLLGTVLPAKK